MSEDTFEDVLYQSFPHPVVDRVMYLYNDYQFDELISTLERLYDLSEDPNQLGHIR